MYILLCTQIHLLLFATHSDTQCTVHFVIQYVLPFSVHVMLYVLCKAAGDVCLHLCECTYDVHITECTWEVHIAECTWDVHISVYTWDVHITECKRDVHIAECTNDVHIAACTWNVHISEFTWEVHIAECIGDNYTQSIVYMWCTHNWVYTEQM